MSEGERQGLSASHAERALLRLKNIPLLIIAVIAVLAAGISLVLMASSRPPSGDSPEAGFARDMMVHHAQAIAMSEAVRDKTESEAIRVLAKEIALTQRGEIGHMQGWLAAWGLAASRDEPAMGWMEHPVGDDAPGGGMPGMATPEELNHLTAAPPDVADTLFLLLMIPHHRGAIPMAEAVLDRSDRPEVERLASYIAASQRQEIELMRNMLRQEELAPVEVELRRAGGASTSGTATFAGSERGVEVELELRDLPTPDSAYLAHIHSGSCDTGDREDDHEDHRPGEADREIEHPLSPVEPAGGHTGSSTTLLEGVTLDQLFSEEPAYLNVHAAGAGVPPQLTCTDLSVANLLLPGNNGAQRSPIYSPD